MIAAFLDVITTTGSKALRPQSKKHDTQSTRKPLWFPMDGEQRLTDTVDAESTNPHPYY
jgi:hypothetical protein